MLDSWSLPAPEEEENLPRFGFKPERAKKLRRSWFEKASPGKEAKTVEKWKVENALELPLEAEVGQRGTTALRNVVYDFSKRLQLG